MGDQKGVGRVVELPTAGEKGAGSPERRNPSPLPVQVRAQLLLALSVRKNS